MLLLSIALLCISICSSQTFSKRANDYISMYNGVHTQPYGYQAMGRAYDTTDAQLHLITFVRNFDFYGNELGTKIYSFPNGRHLNPNFDVNTRLNDTTTVYVVIDTEANNDTVYNTVVWLHNNGDTLKTKRFHSPFHQDGVLGTEQFLPTAVTASPDGQFIYFVTYIGNPPNAINNFIIKKLTAEGDEVWTYINPINSSYWSCSTIEYYEGNLWFVIAGWGFEAYNKLVQLNDTTLSVMNEVELIPNGALLGYAEELIMEEDGVVVACTEFDEENNCLPAFYKMDYAGNLSWLALPPDGEYYVLQKNDHLIKSQDSGYVSCSVKYEEVEVSPGVGNWGEKIWLWKTDADGEFQWQRFYEYLTFDSAFHLVNVAFDLKTTPDGGFVMAGESTTYCPVWPGCEGISQQGWILKVDACGCLVPGCDEECSTVEVQELNDLKYQRFKVGPNPVRDMLNVYLPANLSNREGGVQLMVHDLHGNLIKSFQLKNYDTTYMIDATSLSAGQYILSLVNKGMVLQTEKIVVVE